LENFYIYNDFSTQNNSTKKSKSFKKDIELLQSRFNLGVEELLANTGVLIGSLKEPISTPVMFNGRV
jgi:hypothetical protein